MDEEEFSKLVPSIYGEEYEHYRQKVSIDQLRLGEEIVEISQYILNVGEFSAVAIEAQDVANNKLKVATARAADELRRLPNEDTGKVKSETQVQSELPTHIRVKKALARLERAKLDASLWGALMNALRTKQSSLKTLAELTMAGYMSASTIYAKRKEELNEHRKAKRQQRE